MNREKSGPISVAYALLICGMKSLQMNTTCKCVIQKVNTVDHHVYTSKKRYSVEINERH